MFLAHVQNKNKKCILLLGCTFVRGIVIFCWCINLEMDQTDLYGRDTMKMSE